jgi:cytochrome c oxidase subunit 1
MYGEAPAFLAWLMIFVGFNLTFFPQFIAGQLGMPRRYFNYKPEFEIYNQISTIGSLFIALGFFIALGYIVYALVWGPKASQNPWRALTLEWESESPPPLENFRKDVAVTYGPYDYRGERV